MLAKLHIDFPILVSTRTSPNVSPLHKVEPINHNKHKRATHKKLHSRCSTKRTTSYGGRLPNIFKALDQVEDLDEALKPYTLTHKEMSIILKEQSRLERALGIFEWFKRNDCYEVNVFHYTIVLGILGKAGKWSHVLGVWDEMNSKELAPNSYTYATLIDGYCKGGFHKEALVWLQRMIKQGLKPNEVTYSTLIDMHGKAGRHEEASEIFGLMLREGIAPNTVTYTTLIGMHGKAGRLEEAYQLFALMLKEGIAPNTVTYTTLIDIHGKAGRLKEAYEIFALMLKSGISPNAVTYNTLIDMHGKAGEPKVASELFSLMLREGKSPDTVTFSTMIHIFGNQGQLSKVASLVHKMEEFGCPRNTRVYNLLIFVYAKHDCIDMARNYFTKMKEAFLEPSPVSYATLLYAYSIRNMVSEAEDLILEMDQRGLKIDENLFDSLKRKGNTDEFTFSMMLHMCKRMGKFEEALQIANKMRKLRLLTELLSYNNVIGLYATYGKLQEVVECVKEMMKADIQPDEYTFRSLRLASVESGISEQVARMLEASVQKNASTSLRAWISILSYFV